MNTARCLLVLATLALPTAAYAQTAAELLTVTSILSSTQAGSAVRLPSGTSFVSNPRYAASLAPALLGAEAAGYGDYRLYTARGLATRLTDWYVGQLSTGFAASGYLPAGSRQVQVGGERWTRTDYEGETGGRTVLFVARRADGVYFLTATGR